MENEKRYQIFYGKGENDYITCYLKDTDIIDGYLSEAKAFDIFYSDMIMSNNYLRNHCDNLDYLIDGYNEEEDYYVDEYQVFIIEPEYSEGITIEATRLMGNTLYYDEANEIYLTGITDLGTSRVIVPTKLKVKEVA